MSAHWLRNLFKADPADQFSQKPDPIQPKQKSRSATFAKSQQPDPCTDWLDTHTKAEIHSFVQHCRRLTKANERETEELDSIEV